jgi:FlaA1/EpsC-like NDP-sugar epimerase
MSHVCSVLPVIGRSRDLFVGDITRIEQRLLSLVRASSFLVVGGAGSIGQAVTKEIFKREPKRLHVVDISENNLVELVRDIRSSFGYIKGDFQTLPLDCGSREFHAFLQSQDAYDYILNLSALKHVRSEKDPYTLMRMVCVNILNTEKMLQYAIETGCRKYFAVSSDKAVNPVSAMGATKGVMEKYLMRACQHLCVSTARFANVAFSDGSLLHGFTQRILKKQPLSAPQDVKRYFITPRESGELCLMSALLGENRDLFFPKAGDELRLIDFATIAKMYLESLGYEPYICGTEDEARDLVEELLPKKLWPCYFFDSDTTGEKPFEEFYTEREIVDLDRFEAIGVVKNSVLNNDEELEAFLNKVEDLRQSGHWTKDDIMEPLRALLPSFDHKETHKYLDSRM